MPDSFFDRAEEHYHKWHPSISNKNKSLVPLCKQNYVESIERYESSIFYLSLESKILMSKEVLLSLKAVEMFDTNFLRAHNFSLSRAENQLIKSPARD